MLGGGMGIGKFFWILLSDLFILLIGKMGYYFYH